MRLICLLLPIDLFRLSGKMRKMYDLIDYKAVFEGFNEDDY